MGRRSRIHQYQVGEMTGVSGCVLHGQERAPGVTQYRDGVEPEVPPQPVQIVDLGFNADGLGKDVRGGLAASSLVVVDQPKRTRQPIELGQQVVMVEVGSAVQNDEGSTGADFPEKELRTRNGEVTLAHVRRAANAAGSHRQVADESGLTPHRGSGAGKLVPARPATLWLATQFRPRR